MSAADMPGWAGGSPESLDSAELRALALEAQPFVLAFWDGVKATPAQRRGDVAVLGTGQVLHIVLSNVPTSHRQGVFALLLSTLFAAGAELGVDIVSAAEGAACTARLQDAPAAAGLH